jgi:hypothetical protein
VIECDTGISGVLPYSRRDRRTALFQCDVVAETHLVNLTTGKTLGPDDDD